DLLRAGRQVYLSVGRHRRAPRRYRGHDYYWWQELGGFFERTAYDLPVVPPPRAGAPVHTGVGGGHDLDLRKLHADGVTLLGHAADAVDGEHIQLDERLITSLAQGDSAYGQFTSWVEERLYRFADLYSTVDERENYPDPPTSPSELNLTKSGISTIVWATGFGIDFHDILNMPDVVQESGLPLHERGVARQKGLYFLGLPWLHRLRSPFIRGAEEDAKHIGAAISDQLNSTS
ncbi:MAG: hypothetical protein ACREMY_28940, partial [bacterium]